ncbi:alkaline phosphatase family protein [Sulfolobus tengchongensis]|uniref:Alkaline phosphatase family protein n=1 Tax=Sulfolobus tengchongensis TaxID=207809 RepID=A0AAX4L227_9CREN
MEKTRSLFKTFLVIVIIIFIILQITVSSARQTTTTTPIKHVVIIILENHSFDNLFGTYPFGNPPIYNNITESVMRPVGINFSIRLPTTNGKYVGVFYANNVILQDPTEGFNAYHEDWNFGLMNGFVKGSGVQSLAYVSYQQVPLLWDYAEEYVLADDYFSPSLEATQPNRVNYLIGFPSNITSDSFITNVLPFTDTIMYQLSQYNISWGYFDYGYQQGQKLPPFPLEVFYGSMNYTQHFFNTSVFLQDLKDNRLPDISWVMFTGGDGSDHHYVYDMHPPFNLTVGQINLAYFINAIMESPYWNSTVIFITFDEGGGFYDQVPPPIIPTYGLGYDEFLNHLGIYNYTILGQRIPLLIISPYAKEGWIDNYTLSGYTLLGFLDYNWHLPYLNKIVANSDVQGLLQAFNFSQTPRKPIILYPYNWSYPIPLQFPIHYGYVATIHNNYTGYLLLYDRGLINNTVLNYIMQFSQENQLYYTNLTISFTNNTATSTTSTQISSTYTSMSYSNSTITKSKNSYIYILIIALLSIIIITLIIQSKKTIPKK